MRIPIMYSETQWLVQNVNFEVGENKYGVGKSSVLTNIGQIRFGEFSFFPGNP